MTLSLIVLLYIVYLVYLILSVQLKSVSMVFISKLCGKPGCQSMPSLVCPDRLVLTFCNTLCFRNWNIVPSTEVEFDLWVYFNMSLHWEQEFFQPLCPSKIKLQWTRQAAELMGSLLGACYHVTRRSIRFLGLNNGGLLHIGSGPHVTQCHMSLITLAQCLMWCWSLGYSCKSARFDDKPVYWRPAVKASSLAGRLF